MASRLSEIVMCVRHTSSILAVVAIRSRASSFLTEFLVTQGSYKSVLDVLFLFVFCWEIASISSELGDGQQVHLVTLQVRCEHLPVGRFCSVAILHGPLLMTGSP